MKATKTIKTLSFSLIAGVLISAGAYAQDMDVTMDVVMQSDSQQITERVMRRIDLPQSAQSDRDHRQNDQNRDNHQEWNGSTMVNGNYGDDTYGKREDDRGWEHRDKYRDSAHDAMDDNHQMRDDMHDSRDDSYQMRDDVSAMRDDVHDSRDDSYQMRDDVNDMRDDVHDSRDDSYQMRDDVNDMRDDVNDTWDDAHEMQDNHRSN